MALGLLARVERGIAPERVERLAGQPQRPTGQPQPEGADIVHEPTETDEFESMAKRETLELVRAYYRINDPNVRRRAFELIKALGGEIREAEPVVA